MAAYGEVQVNYPGGVDKQEVSDIRDIFGGFVSKKASNDTIIGEDHSSILASLIDEQESSRCKEVADILAGIAEEIDYVHCGGIEDLMGRVGTPNLAFGTFQAVARQLFSWDSVGGQFG